MALNVNIQSKNGKALNDVIEHEGVNCIPVVTQSYKHFINKNKYFESRTYGIEMAQDFTQVESTENVHNGNDDNYWDGTTIVGRTDAFRFSSTSRPHSGSQSIEITNNADNNNVFQLSNDEIINSDDYDILSGWVYVEQNWANNDKVEIYFYNTDLGETVSDEVNLTNYINQKETEVWQNFNIPLTDFGFLGNYDAIRWKIVVNSSDSPRFFLDDIALQELASASTFIIKPPRNVWWHVTGIGIILVSDYDSTLTDSSMRNIPYNGLIGTSLDSGIVFQRQENGEIEDSFVIKDMMDLLIEYNTQIIDTGYDGEYTWVKISKSYDNEPITLKPEFDDSIKVEISDDLSTLKQFRMLATISEEKRLRGIYDYSKK